MLGSLQFHAVSDWKLAEVTAIYKKAQNQVQEIIDL